jgi:glycosyltransferase involved in cell wall biosynthesis
MSAPRVSVVIPCHNAARWIAETVTSAVEQRGVSLDVVLVDDGSTDDSVAIASVAAGSTRLTTIRQAQLGASAARNAGSAAASAPFIQYLDADDVLMPGTLSARVETLARSGGDVAYADWVRWEQQPDGSFAAGETRARRLDARPELEILVDAWWPPGALLYRRSLVDRILPWREDLPVIQDARFMLDAALEGGRFVHVPHVGVRYRVHDSTSLSRRDPRAFLDDCFRSITDVDRRWTEAAPLDHEQRTALLKCYAFLARSYFPIDRRRHVEARDRMLALDPHYVPDGPRDFRALARVVGYERAEQIAAWCRPLKRVVPALLGR